jgi:geranylgeranyl diphosphate synthase type II
MKNESGKSSWREFSARWLPAIEERLANIASEIERGSGCPADLAAAMKYALLGGGKRLRPLMALAAAFASGGREELLHHALDAACSVELVHCYSLVHDDLPELDNDDYRRGRPSCHKAFGPALALLAGDALLTHAFYLLACLQPPELAAQAGKVLSRAAGPWGMVGGQVDDIRRWTSLQQEAVESLQLRKTAALFSAALEIGGMTAGADARRLESLSRFGSSFGLAFQITDDLLAWRGENERLGRPSKSDHANDRPVHPRLCGGDFSVRRAEELLTSAERELEIWDPPASVLEGLVKFLRQRLYGK